MNNLETKRGGCLDVIVMCVSIGFLGVETSKNTYWVDIASGQPTDRQTMFEKAFTTGQSHGRIERTNISRRIVRNH